MNNLGNVYNSTVGHSITGSNLSMNSNKITNLSDPTANQDAMTLFHFNTQNRSRGQIISTNTIILSISTIGSTLNNNRTLTVGQNFTTPALMTLRYIGTFDSDYLINAHCSMSNQDLSATRTVIVSLRKNGVILTSAIETLPPSTELQVKLSYIEELSNTDDLTLHCRLQSGGNINISFEEVLINATIC
jgi:hypothetical protein